MMPPPVKHLPMDWSYSPRADVLHVTDGVPRETVELDGDGGLFVRYAKGDGRCVGFTIFGVSKHFDDDGIGDVRSAPGAQAFVEELEQAVEAVARGGGVKPGVVIRLVLQLVGLQTVRPESASS